MGKIVVTGANGFVGTAVVHTLLSRGFDVRSVVRHLSSSSTAEETVAVGDIQNVSDWSHALAGAEIVIHLVGRTHIMNDRTKEPLFLYRTVNVEGTSRLARQAVLSGVRRFVYVSSIKVNGERTTEKPFRAEDVPSPEDAYGISKREAEEALAVIARESGMETVVIRPPLVYGPGVKGNFRRLITLISKGAPLPLASVRNRRSMVALDNLVDLVITCMGAPVARNRTFLVSDAEPLSTPRLIRCIAAALGRPSRLFPVPQSLLRLFGNITGLAGEVERLCGSLEIDTSETQRLLNWQPKVSVCEAIRATVDDFMMRRSIIES